MGTHLLRKKSMLLGTLLLAMLCTAQTECISARSILSGLRTKCISARSVLGRVLAGLKTAGKEVAKDLKEDLLSPYQNFYYTLKNIVLRNTAEGDTKSSIANKLFKLLFQGLFKYWLTDRRLIFTPYESLKKVLASRSLFRLAWRLEQFQSNEEVKTLLHQIEKMGLDPEHIHIAPVLPGTSHGIIENYTFTGPSQATLRIPLSSSYSIYSIGHELAHLRHHDAIKGTLFRALLPYIVRTALITTNTLARMSLKTIKEKLQLAPNSKTDKFITWTEKALHYCLRNPLLEWTCNNRFCTYYIRKQEKEADITSATTFNCAKQAIQQYQDLDSRLNSRGRFNKSLLEFFDVHPTCAERIKYLTPIAAAQEQLN